MSITANTGPNITFGQAQSLDYNPDLGPSSFFAGAGILDPRTAYTYQPGSAIGTPTFMFQGFDNVRTLDAIPYSAAVAAIAAAANVVAATPMTLVSAASATTGVSLTSSLVNALTGVVDTNGTAGLVALDSYVSTTGTVAGNVLTLTAASPAIVSVGMTVLTVGGAVTGATPVGMKIVAGGVNRGGVGTYLLNGVAGTVATGTITLQTASPIDSSVPFGMSQTVRAWNPQALLGRAVGITAAASASGTVVFTVRGYDIYGFPMTENITAATNTQTVGKKAWKYIKSVTPATTDAHNYSVDTLDVFGFPFRSDDFSDVLVNYSGSLNPALITANTGYVAADLTNPATATTGDVRGTFAATSSTGANRLSFRQSPSPANIAFTTGLFGLTQYSA